MLEQMFREKGSDPLYLYANMAMGPVVPDPAGQSDMLGDDLLKSSTYGHIEFAVYYATSNGMVFGRRRFLPSDDGNV